MDYSQTASWNLDKNRYLFDNNNVMAIIKLKKHENGKCREKKMDRYVDTEADGLMDRRVDELIDR